MRHASRMGCNFYSKPQYVEFIMVRLLYTITQLNGFLLYPHDVILRAV